MIPRIPRSMICMCLIRWNLEQFRKKFKMPLDRCTVIKNGIDEIPVRKPYQQGEPIRLIHHCTPWRGLSVLLGRN